MLDPDYLTIANGVFLDKAFVLRDDYVDKARVYMNAEVKSLDFAGNSANGVSEINNWVEQKTDGKISNIFEPDTIDRKTVLVLASAVYFQNAWKKKFTSTKNASFCLTPTKHIDVEMMHQIGHFRYHKDENYKFSAVELPYKAGGFEMLIILPDRSDGLNDLENAFLKNSKNFAHLQGNLTVHDVTLDIPKFKFESSVSLVKTMEKLGCTEIFTSSADFSYISTSGVGKLKVSDIKHKAFVNIDENGTEAPGVTGTNLVYFSSEHFPKDIKAVKFHACHPFLFIIKKNTNIIFMGRLSNPNAYCLRIELLADVSRYAMENTANIHYTALTSNYSFTLFKELSSSVEGNVFASTYSIQFLLLLLAFGSKSKTNDQLKSVLHLSKDKPPNYENIKAITTKIEIPGYLTVANGIFSDKAFSLSTDYTKNTQKYLNSEVRSVDFSGNPTSGELEINKWVNNKTNGKISGIFKPGDIDKDTVLVLASAVHFQNVWKQQFTETKKSSFCLSATKHIDITMMHQTGHFNYYKDNHNKFSAVEIPYKVGGFEMLIILPDKMDAVKDLENGFLKSAKNYAYLLGNMTIHNVELDIPKFKFESDLNLEKTMEKLALTREKKYINDNQALSRLGCTDMFSPSADFSELSKSAPGKLRVSSIKHKAFVDVNEDGTEAAAVTGANIVNYNLEYVLTNIKTVKFHACHPFLFIIKKEKDIIFMGRLSNPNA
ncbi:thyroxine-binding globulin-like [Aphis craccivora]|uniref:Thyroxine-binding globulin-like n=1 Tax=Aphis craccivora TaxID=307492 RepID=A0A6G0ZT41_APHCR|nr:thyroxine-binding globulin-like [Aphis craccivora]